MRMLEIDPKKGFDKSDIFGLKPFGERLAMIVENNDEPQVIAIDGEWGSGKSVFARQWAGLLRQRRTPVIEFDAFANDYNDDAFIALAGAVIAHAKEVQQGDDHGTIKAFIDKTAKVGRALIPVGVKLGVKALTLGAVDLSDGRDFEQAMEAAAADTGTYLEKELADRLNKAQSATQMMKGFGEALSGLAKTLAQWERPEETDVKPRLVVIIDELDRCKPSFALDLLEKIKHFYNVDGVSFVLVTNLKQIEAAVKGRYGADTDAATYLQKFISVRFRWNPRSEADLPISVGYVDQCLQRIRPNLHQDHVEVLKFYCQRTDASLRTVERICSYIAFYPNIIFDKSHNKATFFGSIILTLICLRESGIDLTKYNDKNKFKTDAINVLSIASPQNSFEKWVRAYVDITNIKDINQKMDGLCLDILRTIPATHNISVFHRRIERLLNGEAVA
ncbi:MAG TPA: P-loop NTPase fold protein [Azospirillaceae bacterium]|nr:P-loop NTPase fold protein [Azospirillaceae bacterium]HRQ79972.1 P-loop NTPase fold protein [Azospirillaceae bacterium]